MNKEPCCIWNQCCEGCSNWISGCGEKFVNGDGSDSVIEWMKFCPYCGKSVIAELAI